MLSTQSVRSKLLAVGLGTVLLVGIIWLLVGKMSFDRYEHNQKVLLRAHELEIAMLQVRREEKNFLIRDIGKAEFYRIGTSDNLKNHGKAVKALHLSIDELERVLDETEKAEAKKIREETKQYEAAFQNLVSAYLSIGFRDSGLEGSWRKAILDAERRAAQTGNLVLLNNLLELRRNEKDYMLWHRPEDLQKTWSRVATVRALAGRLNNANGTAILQDLRSYQTSFRQFVVMEERIGRTEKSGLRKKMREAILVVEPQVNALVDNAISGADATRRSLRDSILLGSLIGLGLGAVVFAVLANSIAKPITQLRDAAEQVRHGDLDTQINVRSQDEVGVLARSFSEMTQSLRETARMADKVAEGDLRVQVQPQSDKDMLGHSLKRMVENLQQIAATADSIAEGDLRIKVAPRSENDLFGVAFAYMVDNLQRMLSNMTEAINVLSSSSTQIAASTSQVSASAAETAAAVTQTTATVEELRQTAHLSSQKAKDVANMAQQSTQASLLGRQSVDEMVGGMEHIREQMVHIAESVVHLSEQSQQIGDIINTVNDLAEQSNLLAVNAAIEAAKAGEQGKGFAVVAQEVKSLSEQSKQATTQVRSLLNEIQRATNMAVMAAEQGNKAVEGGLQQSVAAGRSIESLSQDIEEAALVATQIAASSQEQLIGVDQVALAMNNIKEASTQNVSSMRQLETAANSLNDVGQDLKTLVQQYHV